MGLGHRGSVSGIREEHPSAHDVPERCTRLSQRRFDDGKASPGLHAGVGIDVTVGPDRGGGGDEDLPLVSNGTAESDRALEGRA